MKCYKILNNDMTSYGGCKWAIGEWNEADSLGPFCRPGGFHGYIHPLLAVLHNPVHARISEPCLFEAEAGGEIAHDGQMKLKAQRMRIVREIPVPKVSIAQRVTYGIYCAKAVYSDQEWNRWADAWLSARDRSWMAARGAAEEAWAARELEEPPGSAEVAAAWAAEAAERAARAAELDDEWAEACTASVLVEAARAAEAAQEAGAGLVSCAERVMGVV